MLPVVAVHEGWVVVTTGVAGAPGAGSMTAVADATQPAAFFTVRVYEPADRPVNCPDLFEKFDPSML